MVSSRATASVVGTLVLQGPTEPANQREHKRCCSETCRDTNEIEFIPLKDGSHYYFNSLAYTCMYLQFYKVEICWGRNQGNECVHTIVHLCSLCLQEVMHGLQYTQYMYVKSGNSGSTVVLPYNTGELIHLVWGQKQSQNHTTVIWHNSCC